MFRRGLALIVLAGLAGAVAAPLAAAIARDRTMACCTGGAKMACCLPSAGCEMKGCSAGARDAVLPGLEPAVLSSPAHAIKLDLLDERLVTFSPISSERSPVPPERPPRG